MSTFFMLSINKYPLPWGKKNVDHDMLITKYRRRLDIWSLHLYVVVYIYKRQDVVSHAIYII